MIIQDRSIKYNPVYKKIYTLWHSMMQRCYQASNGSYKNYGARGVVVSDEWKELDGFIDTIDEVDGFDLSLLLDGRLQLDKDIKHKDNKIYSKENCMFVTPSKNSSNRRNNQLFVAIHLDSESVVLTNNREEFCQINALDSSTVWRMLKKSKGEPTGKRAPNLYKGWYVCYEDAFSINNLPTLKVNKAINIHTDEIVEFTNQSEFARVHDLNPTSVNACLKGRQKKAGNWRITQGYTIDYKDSTTIERQLIALGVIS